jgi:hypothetical protein
MFDVQVSQEVVEYARGLVGEGNYGRRGIADGTCEQQIIGLIGQTVVHDLFGVPRPRNRGRADGGVDFVFQGLAVDVKTMGRNVPPRPDYANNFQALQEQFPTDVFIFCSLNKKTLVLTICGWTNKSELLETATLHPAGTRQVRTDGTAFRVRADLYEISNRDLYEADTLDVFVFLLEWQASLAAREQAREGGRATRQAA